MLELWERKAEEQIHRAVAIHRRLAAARGHVGPRVSNPAIQVTRGRRRRAPGAYTQPEAWVVRHDRDLGEDKAFLDLLRGLLLSWLEAMVLLHAYWGERSLREVAMLAGSGLSVREVDDARRSLLRKVAVALGYLAGEVERLAPAPSAGEMGQRAVALRQEGRTWKEIAATLGVAPATAVYFYRQAAPAAGAALSTRQVAERLGVSVSSVTRLVERGVLRPLHPPRKGQAMRFSPEAVEEIARGGPSAQEALAVLAN